ncbi:MAG: agmatinase family protein [Roseivirga sp.]|nr:agmatinase family protein [Roseivirga sp.]
MSKVDSSTFDPNGVGVKGTLFGLPYDAESADIIVIPVPWDVTVSYGAGTAEGPRAILEASAQIDYAQTDIANAWQMKIAMAEIPEVWYAKGKTLRQQAEKYIDWLEAGSDPKQRLGMQSLCDDINANCAQLVQYVQQKCAYWRSKGKLTILLGGDHSTPLGHLKALAQEHDSFGVLQIDAHADLRKAYEGFTWSHASIMYNALQLPQVEKLVQVGVRDFCEEELTRIDNEEGRVRTFFDQELKAERYQGMNWQKQCKQIISELPQKVYLSFDIDGLHPKLCPNTGTPVPGGFELDQTMYLIKELVKSGRTIIGCDLNEVSPGKDEWDANVGARALYRMALLMAVSQGKFDFRI